MVVSDSQLLESRPTRLRFDSRAALVPRPWPISLLTGASFSVYGDAAVWIEIQSLSSGELTAEVSALSATGGGFVGR
jgi:hypothetical protein